MIQRLSDIEASIEDDVLAGLRMTADDFLDATEKVPGCKYELVDGVVIMSPSGTPIHQRVADEILIQLGMFLRKHPVGTALREADVKIGEGPTGGDLVYNPDVVFYRRERLAGMNRVLKGPPDLVVEVLSPSTRRYDKKTKLNDYERLGVGEYWLLDPENEQMTFYRSSQGLFVEAEASDDEFRSQAVPGFVLDLKGVREAWKPWQ